MKREHSLDSDQPESNRVRLPLEEGVDFGGVDPRLTPGALLPHSELSATFGNDPTIEARAPRRSSAQRSFGSAYHDPRYSS